MGVLVYISVGLDVLAMAVFELLAASAWTRVIGTRQTVSYIWRVINPVCTFSGVLMGCSLLRCSCFNILFLFMISLCMLFRSCLLNFLNYGNLTPHQYVCNTVIHVVNHVIPQLDTF